LYGDVAVVAKLPTPDEVIAAFAAAPAAP
jgi:hypothetical protein